MFLKRDKNFILTLILMVIPLGGLGVDLYAAGMPDLAREFGTSQTWTRMTISAFLFGLFIGMYWFGLFSDRYGRRIFQLINTLVFAVVSLCIAVSHTFSIILVLRFIQGVSSGGLQVVARSMITDVFDKKEVPHVTLYVTSAWGLGPVLAPWVGGILSHLYGWRACFYFFMVYGILMFVFHKMWLPETHHKRLPLHVKRIFHDTLEIIRHRSFIIPVLVMSLCYVGLVCYGVLGPYYIEVYLGHTSVFYGNIGLVTGIGYFFGTICCRFVLARMSRSKVLKRAVIASLFINIIGFILSLYFKASLYVLISNIVLTCFCFGFMYPIYMARSLEPFAHKAGIASGLTVSSMLFLSALSSVVLGFIHVRNVPHFIMVYGCIVLLVFLLYGVDWLMERTSLS